MTEELRKMIMNRSRCKNAYFKNKTIQNWEKYRKLRNERVKYTKKVKKKKNINIKSLTDNNIFWKTVEPIFTNKNSTQKTTLVENGEVIAENIKTAEIFNDYFVNVAKDLNTPGNIPRKLNERLEILHLDHIDIT